MRGSLSPRPLSKNTGEQELETSCGDCPAPGHPGQVTGDSHALGPEAVAACPVSCPDEPTTHVGRDQCGLLGEGFGREKGLEALRGHATGDHDAATPRWRPPASTGSPTRTAASGRTAVACPNALALNLT